MVLRVRLALQPPVAIVSLVPLTARFHNGLSGQHVLFLAPLAARLALARLLSRPSMVARLAVSLPRPELATIRHVPFTVSCPIGTHMELVPNSVVVESNLVHVPLLQLVLLVAGIVKLKLALLTAMLIPAQSTAYLNTLFGLLATGLVALASRPVPWTSRSMWHMEASNVLPMKKESATPLHAQLLPPLPPPLPRLLLLPLLLDLYL